MKSPRFPTQVQTKTNIVYTSDLFVSLLVGFNTHVAPIIKIREPLGEINWGVQIQNPKLTNFSADRERGSQLRITRSLPLSLSTERGRLHITPSSLENRKDKCGVV